MTEPVRDSFVPSSPVPEPRPERRPENKEERRKIVEGLWITGVNPVCAALMGYPADLRELLLARDDARGREISDLANENAVRIRKRSQSEITDRVGHDHHQGVALRLDKFPYAEWEALLKRPVEERNLLVMLDCVQDPQNLGALLRSACFLGVQAVVIPTDRSAQVTATVIKVAAGAAAYLPIARVTNLVRALEQAKEAGLWTVGLDVEAETSLYDEDLARPLVLVVGNEQTGLRPLVKRRCDLLLNIPSAGPIQSLNAATSAAVALAEVNRQRLMA